MKRIEDFLAELESQNIKIWLENGSLRINAPAQMMTHALKHELQDRKLEILRSLTDRRNSVASAQIKKNIDVTSIPMTSGQRRIWSLSRLNPESSVYNVPIALKLEGLIDAAALRAALSMIQSRHEILRTVFPGNHLNEVRQVIKPSGTVALQLGEVGAVIANFEPDEIDQEIKILLKTEASQPFDLAVGTLWRVRIFRVKPTLNYLSVTFHHIIFDGFSKEIFFKELSQIYRSLVNKSKLTLESLPIQYSDFALWQKDLLTDYFLEKEVTYWKESLLDSAQALCTPITSTRGTTQSSAGLICFTASSELSKRLLHFSRNAQVSQYVLCLSVYMITFYFFTGQVDLIVCTPIANRNNSALENLIGYFNNITLVRGDLSGTPSFDDFIRQVRKFCLNAFDHASISLEDLQKIPDLTRVPLARAMFSYQDLNSKALNLEAIKATQVTIRKDNVDFELSLNIENTDGIIKGVLDYNSGLFTEEMAERFTKVYLEVMSLLLSNPETPISKILQKNERVITTEMKLEKFSKIDKALVVESSKTGLKTAYLVLNEHDVPSLDEVKQYARLNLPEYLVPQEFLSIDVVPLDADGLINKSILGNYSSSNKLSFEKDELPSSDLEKIIEKIWREALWLDRTIGLNERFSELGGHSLLWVQVIVRLEKALQMKLSMNMVAAKTIKELVDSIEGRETVNFSEKNVENLSQDVYRGLRMYTSTWQGTRKNEESIIVGLNTSGDKPGIFWCLQRYQELSLLAKYLGPEHPVYGMRSGNYVMVKSQKNIKLLAVNYVNEILEIQPSGPYFIGGNCQAASIAFEVAKHLKKLGHEVGILFLMEKFIRESYDSPISLLFGDKSNRNPFNYFHQPSIGWSKYYSDKISYVIVPGEHGQIFVEPNVQELTDFIKIKLNQFPQQNYKQIESLGAKPILPKTAYNVSFSGPTFIKGHIQERIKLVIQVKNLSPDTLLKSSESGVFLSGRWLNAKNEALQLSGTHIEILEDISSEEMVLFDFEVQLLDLAGDFILQVDLTDEGVAWFSDMGSSSFEIKCNIINLTNYAGEY